MDEFLRSPLSLYFKDESSIRMKFFTPFSIHLPPWKDSFEVSFLPSVSGFIRYSRGEKEWTRFRSTLIYDPAVRYIGGLFHPPPPFSSPSLLRWPRNFRKFVYTQPRWRDFRKFPRFVTSSKIHLYFIDATLPRVHTSNSSVRAKIKELLKSRSKIGIWNLLKLNYNVRNRCKYFFLC